MSRQGYIALVLHAHLPFVRHPEKERAAEEIWLFQAIAESYLPLIDVLERLARDELRAPLTLSVSPTLATMLSDDLLRRRFDRYLNDLGQLIEREAARTTDEPLTTLLAFYQRKINRAREAWQAYDGNILGRLRTLARNQRLDLVTCAATHGYLPLLRQHPQAVWTQLKTAVDVHTRIFGDAPAGIWLPECGYYPGLETFLSRAGLRFFVADAHAFAFAKPPAVCGSYAPLITASSGVAVFGRDKLATIEVWSRERGFPGHPNYREYHRDIGFELPVERLAPLVNPGDGQLQTGLKYYRVTGQNVPKEYYDPEAAEQQAAKDAQAFLRARERQAADVNAAVGIALLGRPPVIVAPFDAELFGHWWYEGPLWIDRLFRQASLEAGVEFVDFSTYLRRHPAQQVAEPAESSWGEGGYHQYWLNESNDWIYAHLDQAAVRMTRAANQHARASGALALALNQAARELLLAQASDWAFIMRSNTTVNYAVQRTELHLRRFAKIMNQVDAAAIDLPWLTALNEIDNIFPEIDFRNYQTTPTTPGDTPAAFNVSTESSLSTH